MLRKVLLSRPDHLGDLILTLPALWQLKSGGAHLTLVAAPGLEHLHPAMTWVDEIWSPKDMTVERLRQAAFDAAVFFWEEDPHARLALEVGIPLRSGWKRSPKDLRLFNRGLWRSHRVSSFRPQVFQNLDLVNKLSMTPASAGIHYHFNPSTFKLPESVSQFQNHSGQTEWILLALEAQSALAVSFSTLATLARHLLLTYPRAAVGLMGTSKASHTAQKILAEIPEPLKIRVLDATGQTSVSELAAWIAHARLLLGPSTGTAHLAAACGTPQICVLVTQNINPCRWAPWDAHALAYKETPHCAIACTPWNCALAVSTCQPHISAEKLFALCQQQLDKPTYWTATQLRSHLLKASLEILCDDPQATRHLQDAGYQAHSLCPFNMKFAEQILVSHKINVLVLKQPWRHPWIYPLKMKTSNLTAWNPPVYVHLADLEIPAFETWAYERLGLGGCV